MVGETGQLVRKPLTSEPLRSALASKPDRRSDHNNCYKNLFCSRSVFGMSCVFLKCIADCLSEFTSIFGGLCHWVPCIW